MLIFLHVPKTAGSTFQLILENTFGMSHCHTFHIRKRVFDRHDLVFARKMFPRLRSIGGGNIIDPLGLEAVDPFYITFMREPVARVFSHYQHAVRSGSRQSFEEMIRAQGSLENLHVKLMSGGRDLGRAKAFLEKAGLVGFTEQFDRSLQVLDRLSPLKLNLHYRRKQVAPDNTVRKSLEKDARAIELAREFNRLDIELYEFARSEIFPRLCEKAGVKASDPIPSYDNNVKPAGIRYRAGRFYNRVFRQMCKLRPRGKEAEAPPLFST
jgi:hypothetical protein